MTRPTSRLTPVAVACEQSRERASLSSCIIPRSPSRTLERASGRTKSICFISFSVLSGCALQSPGQSYPTKTQAICGLFKRPHAASCCVFHTASEQKTCRCDVRPDTRRPPQSWQDVARASPPEIVSETQHPRAFLIAQPCPLQRLLRPALGDACRTTEGGLGVPSGVIVRAFGGVSISLQSSGTRHGALRDSETRCHRKRRHRNSSTAKAHEPEPVPATCAV